MPCVVLRAWLNRARRAAKYAVAEKSAFWSRSVSSTAFRTTAVFSLYKCQFSCIYVACQKIEGSHMVLILKLGRLDFLEFLSERRHDCRYLKARQRKCHKGRQS